MANKHGHIFTLPPEQGNEIFDNNVYFLNNTSTLNNLIKELLEGPRTGLQTLCQRIDGEPQVVDVEFAPCLGQELLQRLQTLVASNRHLPLQNALH